MGKFSIIVLVMMLCSFIYLFTADDKTSVIDAHYDGSTAQIIVDGLPLAKSKKIEWWEKNQQAILKKYSIPSGNKTPFLIAIYAFGNGYEAQTEEDKLCFSDIKSPQNCIDKNTLMLIWRTRDGGVKYQF